MKENELWYGYLEAGPKSTAVLLDRQLETGNPSTMYLFNLSKCEILEYSREVAEPKLRALASGEGVLVERLTAAYGRARAEFQPRGTWAASVPERRRRPSRESVPLVLVEEDAELNEREESEDDLGNDVEGYEDT